MPNEHLSIPRNDAEWQPFRRAAREALGEGEIADRWLAENPTKGIDEFARLTGRQGNRTQPEGNRFDNWQNAEKDAIQNETSFAGEEATTFAKIAAEDAKKSRFPTIDDVPLSGVAADLSRLPRPLNPDELAARRQLPDRGPWEAAFDALGQFGLRPDDDRFRSVMEDARTRVRRSAGDLADGFGAFLRATEIAVATANNETLPSATQGRRMRSARSMRRVSWAKGG